MEDEFDRSRAEKYFSSRTGQLSATQNPSKNHKKVQAMVNNMALHGLTGAETI